ncbi:hypothetical protein [Erythrobacter sp.]|uniref:hypothetical protein n=1 Tax=Erythrobacter sp. TaxID=1042 RepID=UPI0031201AD6
MTDEAASDRPWWESAFIEGLKQFGKVTAAAEATGITTSGPYTRKKKCGAFSRAWDEALEIFALSGRKAGNQSAAQRKDEQWKKVFLEELAETSNVTASAAKAGVPTSDVYRSRRANRDFAAQWRAALFEGYANLEMEVLGYLRDPAPARKMDVAVALRLLAAHKETIAKERAQRANVSAAQVRETIERKVEELRQKVAGRDISPA